MLVLEIIACESTPIYNFWCEDILEIAVKLHLTVFCGILFVVLHYSCTVGFCLFWWRVSLEFTCRRKRKVMQDLLYEFSRTINCRRRNTCVMRIHLETTKQVQILLKRHESKWWRWGEWEMLFCMLCVCLSLFSFFSIWILVIYAPCPSSHVACIMKSGSTQEVVGKTRRQQEASSKYFRYISMHSVNCNSKQSLLIVRQRKICKILYSSPLRVRRSRDSQEIHASQH